MTEARYEDGHEHTSQSESEIMEGIKLLKAMNDNLQIYIHCLE